MRAVSLIGCSSIWLDVPFIETLYYYYLHFCTLSRNESTRQTGVTTFNPNAEQRTARQTVAEVILLLFLLLVSSSSQKRQSWTTALVVRRLWTGAAGTVGWPCRLENHCSYSNGFCFQSNEDQGCEFKYHHHHHRSLNLTSVKVSSNIKPVCVCVLV